MKLEAFQKARWYISNGYPPAWVAERLGVSRTSIWTWRRHFMKHDHAFKELRRRVLLLPRDLREQIATAVADARRAA